MNPVSCDVVVLKRVEESVGSLSQDSEICRHCRALENHEKREKMSRPVLSEVWALDRPKRYFNIKILSVLKLIGTSRKSVQIIQREAPFLHW